MAAFSSMTRISCRPLVSDPRRLDRIREADLVEPHAHFGEHVGRDLETPQHLHQVEVRLAASHDPEARVRARNDMPIDAVDAAERGHRSELVGHPRFDAQRREVGPADVQAVGRRRMARSRLHCGSVDPSIGALQHHVEVDCPCAFDDFGQRGQSDPRAAVARQRPTVQTELQHLRDVGRRDDRHVPSLERLVALERHRRRDAAVVVAGDDEHAAVRRRAVGVAVLQCVTGAIHPRALAVPHREHAIDAALGVRLDALRAEHLRGGELLVDRGDEAHTEVGQARSGFPDREVDHAERRSAIAADEAAGVQAGGGVALALHREQAHERLRAGQKNRSAVGPKAVRQTVVRAAQSSER